MTKSQLKNLEKDKIINAIMEGMQRDFRKNIDVFIVQGMWKTLMMDAASKFNSDDIWISLFINSVGKFSIIHYCHGQEVSYDDIHNATQYLALELGEEEGFEDLYPMVIGSKLYLTRRLAQYLRMLRI